MSADAPPNRAHLAAKLRVFAHPASHSSHFGHAPRRELLEYLKIAEDTIEAQAAMLRADLTELASHRRDRAQDAETNAALRGLRDRLCADSTALRTLALSTLYAAGVCEADAAEIIRRTLEHTPVTTPTNDATPPPSPLPPAVAAQANRYFAAVHGRDWVYKAPEQFPNLVEQWIWAVAAADLDLAEKVMTRIETMAAEAKA